MKTRLALALFALSIACPAVGTVPRSAVGRVVDTGGHPIVGATVHLLPAGVAGTAGISGTDATAGREALVSARTDAHGRFAVKKLPAGAIDLAVRARRFAPVLLRGVVPSLVPGSPAGAPADLGKIVLQAGAVLTGSVEDPEGRPLAGAIAEHETLVLSDRDRKAFFDAMVHPPEPSERLARALAEHQRRVAS